MTQRGNVSYEFISRDGLVYRTSSLNSNDDAVISFRKSLSGARREMENLERIVSVYFGTNVTATSDANVGLVEKIDDLKKALGDFTGKYLSVSKVNAELYRENEKLKRQLDAKLDDVADSFCESGYY